MKKIAGFLSVSLLTVMSGCFTEVFADSGTVRDYTEYVDTRMGTDSRFELSNGSTYPGTGRPFGMHLWSPQTGEGNIGWKYTWKAEMIHSFTLSHQCSPWCGDYASIAFFPETGDVPVLPQSERGAEFRHRNETAHPEYYSVTFRNGISTEMAPTDRCVSFRFRFPDNGERAFILLDLCRYAGESVAVGKKRIEGNIRMMWRNGKCLENYFVIEFSVPFREFSTWEEDGERGACVAFPAGTEVEVKVGTSYISPEQAKLNLEREIGKRGFDEVREEGREVWNALLGRIDVSGGSEEDMRTFYTCLYRANLNSRMFYELAKDGHPYYFSPYDFTVHDGYMYTDNGFWDSFHAQFPLFNILHTEQQGRYMKALLDAYDQFGWLPSWSNPGEGGGMSGNHAISLLADAWVKGIRTVDPKRVLEAYVHEITSKGPLRMSNGRYGFEEYWRLGYVPYPDYRSSTTVTMEYAYDDWCGMLFAKEVGDEYWTRRLEASSHNWRNVYSPEVDFMRGRAADGSWTPDFRPGAWGGPFEETNSWQGSFSVFHDIDGMMEIYGGRDAFCTKLDSLFNEPALIDFGFNVDVWNEMVEMVLGNMGMYNHGNQPCHHIPYLYVYGGQPWKTQKYVRYVMDRLYRCAPAGYPGDDDQGTMSSWYVLSALGIYCVCPGSTEYVIGSPLFERAVVTLENGNKFEVIAEGNDDDHIYADSLSFNGTPLDRFFLDHSQIMAGGTLRMKMAEYAPGR